MIPDTDIDRLEQLQAAEAELTAAIRPAVFDLLTGGLPFLAGLFGLVAMIRHRSQIRRAHDQLVSHARDTVVSDACDDETVLRIKLALPDWARLERDESGRWLVIDTDTASDPDTLIGAQIVAVLQAPSWAARMTDEELERWARSLCRRRSGDVR